LIGFQKWPYFGSYQSRREEKISELKKQTDLLAEDLKPPPSSYFKPAKPVPAIQDVIGRALPMIGPYKRLDIKQQVVALIDDVSKYKHTEVAAASDNMVQLFSSRFFK
jgi:dihydropyrimidine dehydrogenase (NADP+)